MAVLKRRSNTFRLRSRAGGSRNKVLLVSALVLLATAAWLTNTSSGDQTEYYFVAVKDLPQSAAVDATSVEARAVKLSTSSGRYLRADDNELDKWYLTKPMLAGELIPLSSLANRKEAKCSPIILTLGTQLPTAIKVGSALDLWAANPIGAQEPIPYEVALDAELIAINTANDGLGQQNQSIEVCVSVAEVRSVVAAIAERATLIAVRAIS
jgi:hypothetical protein